MKTAAEIIKKFHTDNGDCCAGCDFWRFHNSVVGDCIKTSPVSSVDSLAAIGIESPSIDIGAGHVITQRDHVCGEFKNE